MPLVDISAQDATLNRKTNPHSGWGDRGSPNRVEPVAKPSFEVPFTLAQGEAVFTIGSCFARNIESELINRGFRVPVRDLFQNPDFKGLEVGIINNYGTPSIYNEIAWAFGEEEFKPEDHIVELMPGKYADLHLSPAMRPDSYEIVMRRRTAALEATRAARGCRVVIMTLGLTEVWFDTRTGFYLNVAPRPALLKADPERFRLHVLNYEETYDYLERAVKLLQKHGPSELRLLLTVSPVPLTVTHRNIDVLVANTYSKSALRTAAETIVARFPFASYYPSYESIVITDRKIAFLDDMRHVSDEMIRLNIGRMVEAFSEDGGDPEQVRERIGAGGAAVAVEQAALARGKGVEAARLFFEEFGSWSRDSVEFAMEHARYLMEAGDHSAAIRVLVPHEPEHRSNLAVIGLLSEGYLRDGRAGEALSQLDHLPHQGIRSIGLWDNMLAAAIAVGDPDTIVSVLTRVTANVKTRAPLAHLLVARFFRDRGERERAIPLYVAAWQDGLGANVAALELSELLLILGRSAEAKSILNGVRPTTAREVQTTQRLGALAGVF